MHRQCQLHCAVKQVDKRQEGYLHILAAKTCDFLRVNVRLFEVRLDCSMLYARFFPRSKLMDSYVWVGITDLRVTYLNVENYESFAMFIDDFGNILSVY